MTFVFRFTLVCYDILLCLLFARCNSSLLFIFFVGLLPSVMQRNQHELHGSRYGWIPFPELEQNIPIDNEPHFMGLVALWMINFSVQ